MWSGAPEACGPTRFPHTNFHGLTNKPAPGTGIWTWVVSDRRGLRVPGKPCWHGQHDSYLAYNAIQKLSTARIFRTAENAQEKKAVDNFNQPRAPKV
ncbi:MAG TPA: hypothetical protein DD856_11105 [Sulfobacillus sp.]|nr:hypothetical protein [Sulfobacillus sp.]